MKSPLPIFALALALLAPAGMRAEETAAAFPEGSELEGKMEKMNGAFRKLRRQVADPAQNAASLELVAKLRAATTQAAATLPDTIGKLSPEKQAAAKTSYMEKMKELLATIDELSAALKADKNEEAVKIIENLRLQEAAGHKEFRPKKKQD